jgi:hypothetical protein
MTGRERTVTVSATTHLEFGAQAVWPLLCPVREYDWIDVWDCELVHSESGVNELGCVFRTAFPSEGDRETWVTSRYEPPDRLEFVRVNSWRAIRFVIELAPEPGGTRVAWTHHVTPLNAQGEAYVRAKPEMFKARMTLLGKMLAHYLETGEMLRGGEPGLVKEIGHVHGGKAG